MPRFFSLILDSSSVLTGVMCYCSGEMAPFHCVFVVPFVRKDKISWVVPVRAPMFVGEGLYDFGLSTS